MFTLSFSSKEAKVAKTIEERRAYMRAWEAKRKAAGIKRVRPARAKGQYISEAARKTGRQRAWRQQGIVFSWGGFLSMLEAQGNRCAICHREVGTAAVVDHNHVTGKVRGLLCMNCNTGIGNLGDNPLTLEAAAAYIRRTDGN